MSTPGTSLMGGGIGPDKPSDSPLPVKANPTVLSKLTAVSATSPATLDKLAAVQQVLMSVEQVHIATEHILHGGLYSRTIRLDKDIILTGALMKIPTLLIVNGYADVLVGDDWKPIFGYNVIPASAGRKQIFITRTPVQITMVFPTSAKTVEEAEAQFTDEAALLMSRTQETNTDLVVITGE